MTFYDFFRTRLLEANNVNNSNMWGHQGLCGPVQASRTLLETYCEVILDLRNLIIMNVVDAIKVINFL